MKGLMQEVPLNLSMIVRHAERFHGAKTVTTNTPDGPSVRTFTETIERARRLAGALQALGVESGDRVATFGWNHQAHLEAYIAVPCMGAVLHTLNIRLFPDDLAYIVRHASDRVVVVDKSLWPLWEPRARQVDCIERTIVVDDASGDPPVGALDYETMIAEAEPISGLPEIDESSAAAMCYTSGTTGNPKGVVYSHRSQVLHTYAALMPDGMGLRESDTILPIVPLFHANAWGLPYQCLMAGVNLVMPGAQMDPEALTRLLVEQRTTVAAGVPTIWQAMLEPLSKVEGGLGPLRSIICGGAAIPLALQQAYHERFGVRISHAWGMTETSPIGSMCWPLAAHRDLPDDEIDAILNSQGRAVPGVEIRLRDENGEEVAQDGEAFGEIQVRGNWVAAAYYGEEPSEEKFADGWLRTGDVATIDSAGYIRIVDRTKDVIKSGGEWVSSVKLEGLIMGHPGVAEAAVVGLAHPKWDERPLACVVARDGAEVTRDSILEYLAPQVARWWLPEDVVLIEEVPKTSVGKFDKKVLRKRFADHFDPSRGLE
jgi:fatty-acyl-CoA synthase